MSVKVGMISLGCSKNQVDAELLLAMLADGGFEICADEEACEVIVVNTCGFIEDAKRESIDNILECCARKADGTLRAVVVTGCLAERYREQVALEIPEADVILGIGRNSEIVDAVKQALEGKKLTLFGEKGDLSLEGKRILANDSYFAYLKVAEGCDNRCTYCAIPLIRGSFRSRPIEKVVQEAKELAAQGVRELNVVAQDTTRYGEDLYGKLMLPELLRQLCTIDGIHWVRLLYCYPERITDELLDTIAAQEKIVNYIDIPLQHANERVLARMNRRGDHKSLVALMAKIRAKLPGVALRTTLIAGFPGESEAEFSELCEFLQEVRFERLGCFAYSQEEDTPAAVLEDQLDEEIKRHRAELVMEQQYPIAETWAETQLGRKLEVLIEAQVQPGSYYGRSYMDAPDIDTRVFFTSESDCKPGDFVWVEIEQASEYDLVGRMVQG